MPPFQTIGPFPSLGEAKAAIEAWWGACAEAQRPRRERQKAERQERRRAFAAGVLNRRDAARRLFLRTRLEVVVLDGVAYSRREFRMLDRGRPRPGRTRGGARRRRIAGSRVRARARAPGSREDDDEDDDVEPARGIARECGFIHVSELIECELRRLLERAS